ncbi:MAG: 50S ribosomal protein L24 [Patescibacteria group bacterium]|nr:50S ribosomal protein L24 [Patescibacteria group bacterium]
MKIKKGDKVIVIAGKDAGKTGTVSRAFPKENRVLVDGVNMRKKHEKPRGNARKGQIVERGATVHVSNVMILDPKTNKGTRIRIKRENGTRTRIAKSGAEF